MGLTGNLCWEQRVRVSLILAAFCSWIQLNSYTNHVSSLKNVTAYTCICWKCILGQYASQEGVSSNDTSELFSITYFTNNIQSLEVYMTLNSVLILENNNLL